MKLWTWSSSDPREDWPKDDSFPDAKELPGGLTDSLGRHWRVRYLGSVAPTVADVDAQVSPQPTLADKIGSAANARAVKANAQVWAKLSSDQKKVVQDMIDADDARLSGVFGV